MFGKQAASTQQQVPKDQNKEEVLIWPEQQVLQVLL
jgi:hypothetical protein